VTDRPPPEKRKDITMAKATTARKPQQDKPLTGKFDNPPSEEDEKAAGGQLVPLSEREIDAAIIASAGENEISVEITEKMLAGRTIDEILGSSDPTESLVGVIFRPLSWSWGRSAFGNRKGAFVVLKVGDANGRERTVTSGSPNIMAALRAFEKTDVEIPPLTVREHPTTNGFSTFRFHKAQAA
jgi:hypothetical protein